jgi:ribosomal protein S3AE
MTTDIFYIKTKDGTDIAVFDLEISGNEIGYSWNAVEEDIKSEPYESEVEEILSKIITEKMINERKTG